MNSYGGGSSGGSSGYGGLNLGGIASLVGGLGSIIAAFGKNGTTFTQPNSTFSVQGQGLGDSLVNSINSTTPAVSSNSAATVPSLTANLNSPSISNMEQNQIAQDLNPATAQQRVAETGNLIAANNAAGAQNASATLSQINAARAGDGGTGSFDNLQDARLAQDTAAQDSLFANQQQLSALQNAEAERTNAIGLEGNLVGTDATSAFKVGQVAAQPSTTLASEVTPFQTNSVASQQPSIEQQLGLAASGVGQGISGYNSSAMQNAYYNNLINNNSSIGSAYSSYYV